MITKSSWQPPDVVSHEDVMNNPAASCGVSELGDEICLKAVTPECFYRGSSSKSDCGEPQSNHRLKHAGMTDFG